MTGQATFDIQNFGSYRVVVASGEIDIGNARDFRAALQEAAPAGAEALIVSLRDVTYLDSNALAILIEVSRRFAVSRRQLHIVAPPHSACRMILNIAGIPSAIPAHDSIEEAAAHCTTS